MREAQTVLLTKQTRRKNLWRKKNPQEGQTGVDEETAANAVSEEEAEAAGFSDHEESADDQEASR